MDDDFYVQSDTLLPADIFDHFRNRCIETYEHDPANFLSAPGLAKEKCLKKTRVKFEFFNWCWNVASGRVRS